MHSVASGGRPVLAAGEAEIAIHGATRFGIRITPHSGHSLNGASKAVNETATWPQLSFDADAVSYGAATHDVGKALYPNELTGPGNQHESAGYRLLLDHGAPERRARFARTHARWDGRGRTRRTTGAACTSRERTAARKIPSRPSVPPRGRSHLRQPTCLAHGHQRHVRDPPGSSTR
jgi:hypothetical protein